jgi:hypothetical protein
MSSNAPTEALAVHGVTLAEFAGVSAALAEGLPLDAVLASESIPKEAWLAAAPQWKVRAAKDGALGPLFAELRDRRAVAEDCLQRRVAPIDSDLAAWMSFLKAYGAHPAPFELLHSSGLGLNDMARLQRSWAKRMALEPALEKQAEDLSRKGLGPVPALRVGPAKLKPFPWTRRASASTASHAVPRAAAPAVAPADTSMAPGKLRLYSYVAIKARLAERPGDEQRVLAELGITDFANTDAGWQAVLANDKELERDYRRLLEAQRAKLKSGARATPAAAPSPERAEVHAGQERPQPPAAPPLSPAPNRLAGTSLALEPPRAPALPFAPGATPSVPSAAPAPRPAPAKLAGTSLAVDMPNKQALPFGDRPKSLAGTSLALDPPVAPALPFAGASPPAPNPRPRPKLAETSLAVDVPNKAALPFASEGPPLTLEQHASLACEIAFAPERALETLARYHITPAQKVECDQYYAALFVRDPTLRARWEEAKRTYAEFLASSSVSR